MTPARKESWKTGPMPHQTAVLRYGEEFSSEEFARIALGLIPQEMEDKWFVYLDGTTLNLHRSWTGICVYQVELEAVAGKYVVRRALVNRDPTQNRGTDDVHDSALLHFLIGNMLLGKQLAFPLPGTLSGKDPMGTYQHHISGTAYPEKAVDPNPRGGPAGRRPWWKFW